MSKKEAVCIVTNGCAKRNLDVTRMRKYFKMNGCVIHSSPARVDYIIFVTCAFSNLKKEECFEYIRKLSTFNGELIICGCLPVTNQGLSEVFTGRMVSTKDIHMIDTLFPHFTHRYETIPDAHSISLRMPMALRMRVHLDFSKRFFRLAMQSIMRIINLFKKKRFKHAYLRIANGCINTCAYCAARTSIGVLKSKSIEQCVEEYTGLLRQGCREITLIADDTGSFGLDRGTTFAELLEKLDEVTHDARVKWNIFGLHTRWAISYQDVLVRMIEKGRITDLLCPIQSGSDAVLKRMERHTTREEMVSLFARFRAANDQLLLKTHLIVGFPTETESDFEESLEFFKKVKFDRVLVLGYADMEGTTSYDLPDKLTQDVIDERCDRMYRFLKQENIQLLVE